MSIERLKSDLHGTCAEQVKKLTALSTVGDIVNHLQNTVWPFLEALTNETAEIDETVSDMYESADDILQPESAALISAVVAGAQLLMVELEQRVGNDARLLQAIREWRGKAKQVMTLVEEVSLPEDTYEDGDEDGDEGEDEGDDDDDDDDEDDKPKETGNA